MCDEVGWRECDWWLLHSDQACTNFFFFFFFFFFFGSIAYESAELLDLNMSSVFQINHDHFAIHMSKSG